MKESMWGYYLVVMGIAVSIIMIFMTNLTTTEQQNYYLLKEVANAAMIDSIDFGYYRKYGEIKINKEKFVENFLRRFAEGISKTNTYKVEFYSIYENPPSASIKIISNTGDYNIVGTSTNMDIINTIDVIMESNNSMGKSIVYQSTPYGYYYDLDSEGYAKIWVKMKLNSTNFYTDLANNFKVQLESQGKNFDEKNIEVSNIQYLYPYLPEDKHIVLGTSSGDGGIYDYAANYNDMPSITLNDPNASLYTDKIKDVKMTILTMNDGSKVLAWTGKFICDHSVDEVNTNGVVKQFRFKPSVRYMTDNPDDSTLQMYNKEYGNGDGSVSDLYITMEEYEDLSDEARKSWEGTPYYKSCIPAIKYRMNIYYNNSLG